MEKISAMMYEGSTRGQHQSKTTFVEAFGKQNQHVDSAIKSLDNLNDQIVQFIYTPTKPCDRGNSDGELSVKDHERLKSSMSLMRHLLVDAQVKFRKMVDDNKRLAARIDGSINIANKEVKAIRDELVDTNRRLNQLSSGQTQGSPGGEVLHMEPEDLDLSLRKDEKQDKMSTLDNQEKEELSSLKEENDKLRDQLDKLRGELKILKEQNSESSDSGSRSPPPYVNMEVHQDRITLIKSQPMGEEESGAEMEQRGLQLRELQHQMIQAHQELTRAKEALLAMKADRKRLQGEKLELLSQLRQLYCTLEDKESEIRDFIRNFELQMRESNDSIKQMAAEKEDSEQEKWEILKRAQEASERCVLLKGELETSDTRIHDLEMKFSQAQDQIRNLENRLQTQNLSSPRLRLTERELSLGPSDRALRASTGSSSSCSHLKSSSVSVDSVLKPSSSLLTENSPSSEELPPYQEIVLSTDPTPSMKSLKSDSSHYSYTCSGQNLCQSLEHIQSMADSSRSSDELASHQGNTFINIPSSEIRTVIDLKTLQKKRRSTSALSRLFGKSRSRRSIAVSDPSMLEDRPEPVSPRLSMLTEDNFQGKLEALRQARVLGISGWKAGHVLSWLEIEMNMPMYGRACSENIKSGKVLLGLSDTELDSALSLDSPLHRRKLRLAIEELRNPDTIQFPKAARLDHTWIAHRWLPDLGLPQYSATFEAQLVDGRLLHVLTKKDLEKHLGVQRRFHQNSILIAVELLRRLRFDKEELAQRRCKSEASDTDLLVWTNVRILQWLQTIDLQEYSKSMNESGIHGAFLVLEPSFTAESFATVLNIPSNKSYVRRHLASELDNLVRPARAATDSQVKKPRSTSSTSLNRSFVRSYRGPSTEGQDSAKGGTRRLSFRGSIGRAFSRKSRQDAVPRKAGELSKESEAHRRSVSVDAHGTSV